MNKLLKKLYDKACNDSHSNDSKKGKRILPQLLMLLKDNIHSVSCFGTITDSYTTTTLNAEDFTYTFDIKQFPATKQTEKLLL